jgi:hypothetical protein
MCSTTLRSCYSATSPVEHAALGGPPLSKTDAHCSRDLHFPPMTMKTALTDRRRVPARSGALLWQLAFESRRRCLDSSQGSQFGGRGRSRLQAAMDEGSTDQLVFFAFDLLYLNGDSTAQLPLLERKKRLQTLFKKEITDCATASTSLVMVPAFASTPASSDWKASSRSADRPYAPGDCGISTPDVQGPA